MSEVKHTPGPWEPLRQGIEVQSAEGNHAPELLIALQNLLEACTEAEEFKIRRGWQAAQARVAIAKATGKE